MESQAMKSSIPQKYCDSGHSKDGSCVSSAFANELEDEDDVAVEENDDEDDEQGVVEGVQGTIIS